MVVFFRFLQSIIALLLLASCSILQSSMPAESAPANALLLEPDVFPNGWTFESDEMGVIVAGRDFYLPNAYGHSFQEIYQRPSNYQAHQKFKTYLEGEFNVSIEDQSSVPFTSPSEITFKSQIADEYYFACGVNEIPQCKMLARYQNYFAFFYFELATTEPGGLTYSEIEDVLEAFEAKVSEALNISSE